MTRAEQELDFEKKFKGKHVTVNQLDGGIYNGMVNEVAVWDGQLILHVRDKRFAIDLEDVPEMVTLQ